MAEPSDGQWPEVNPFFGKLRIAASVESLYDRLEERFVVGDGGEVPTAADHQRLAEGRLEAMVSLLRDSVLVRATGMDPCRTESVVTDQRREAIGECTPSAALQLMGRRSSLPDPPWPTCLRRAVAVCGQASRCDRRLPDAASARSWLA